ncbi:MAG: tryptophan synthase subunit alpha [Halobacteriales archaeon]|nr:tryptophan synthase subunit alpha [Halobacteriales archaeon]
MTPATGIERLRRRIASVKAEKRAALSIYLPVGFPDLPRSAAAMEAAVRGGADWLEVGLPFSDPAADGPILQAASTQALLAGTRFEDALATARRLRQDHPDLPLVAMTYANLVHRSGWRPTVQRLADAGFDGLIVPDAPLEEAAPLRDALAACGLAHVPLVTPTTPPGRMRAIAATATGFLYVVANVGVTGQADPGARVVETVRRAREAAPDARLMVGFGIRGPDDVRRIHAAGADGCIVGSHVVQRMQQGAGPEQVAAEVARLRMGC